MLLALSQFSGISHRAKDVHLRELINPQLFYGKRKIPYFGNRKLNMNKLKDKKKTQISVVSFYNFKFEFMHTRNKFERQSLK